MGGGGEQGGLGWSSNPSTVFKCLHMSAFSLNSIGEPLRLPALMFLPCGNLLCTARLQPIIGPPFPFKPSFLTISESDCAENRDGTEEGKSDILF